jgi:hypothetical protein
MEENITEVLLPSTKKTKDNYNDGWIKEDVKKDKQVTGHIPEACGEESEDSSHSLSV